nr:immunoglobulin light chain junction region [Macaca mulatta]
CMQPLQTPCTC